MKEKSSIALVDKDFKSDDLNEIPERSDENLLKKMVDFTEELINTGSEQIAYQKILGNLLFISNAKYGTLSLINENTGKLTTVAVAGFRDKAKKLTKILGFDLVGKEWSSDYDSRINEKLSSNVVSHFSSLSEVTQRVLPNVVSKTIQKIFNLGEVTITKIIVKGEMIGDFSLIMSAGNKFENDHLVEIYSRQIDMFITRLRSEKAIQELNEKLHNEILDKDRFISILAHDLRAPFNSILGFLNLLIENIHEWDIETIEKQIKMINNTAENTYSLLSDILTWAGSKSGKLSIVPEKMSFTVICDEVVGNLRVNADVKNIDINHFAVDDFVVMADRNMLATILRNLISNAIKFTDNNGNINIYAEKIKEELVITVSDNGTGIEKDMLSGLFDFTFTNSTNGTANECGTGLGLMICKEFVIKHNGEIWAESELGRGSKFKFTMPLHVD